MQIRSLFLVGLLLGCVNLTYAQDIATAQTSSLQVEQTSSATRDFIIFYDRTLTNAPQLIAACQKLGAELLYEYKNFNAIAVHIPENLELSSLKTKLSQIKGVLEVNESQMMQLH
ncbi:Uncharacterised protein [uncultured Avibacterium sp.]|uniref:Inhibitor I9 domain-containing protein n=1 Tax=uncultured Avibacterium sp. TaxID=1936169 RepID=A0A486XBC5_9PAST|nr:Uncharacterised protein [uncultured Avibacterium sp.]